MLGWLKFFRLIWRLKLFDTACMYERPRYRGKRETETDIPGSRRGVVWMCNSFYPDLPSSYMA